MTKTIHITILLLVTFLCYGQNNNDGVKISFGPTISIPKTSKLTNTDIDGSPEIRSEINIGLYILPSLEFPLNQILSLETGIGFQLDRFSIEDEIGFEKSEGTRNLGHLQLPITLNSRLGKGNSYSFGIGGFLNYLLFANEKGETTTGIIDVNDPSSQITTVSFDNDISDGFNSLSFGATASLKTYFQLSSNSTGYIMLRFNQHINTIKNVESNNFGSFESKNEKEPSTLMLGFGFFL